MRHTRTHTNTPKQILIFQQTLFIIVLHVFNKPRFQHSLHFHHHLIVRRSTCMFSHTHFMFHTQTTSFSTNNSRLPHTINQSPTLFVLNNQPLLSVPHTNHMRCTFHKHFYSCLTTRCYQRLRRVLHTHILKQTYSLHTLHVLYISLNLHHIYIYSPYDS